MKIRIDAPPASVDVANNFTIEFWMKAEAGANTSPTCTEGGNNWINGNTIIDRDVYGDGDYGDYGISLAGGRIAFGVAQGATANTICGTTDLADGNWHHVALTRNATSGTLRIFVDGQLERQGTGPVGDISYRDGRSTSYPNSDPFLVLGAEKHDAGSSYPSFSGWLDELRISNVERYSAAFTPLRSPFNSDSSTVGLYHFDEAVSQPCTGIVLDSSGNGANGTCNFGGSAPGGPVYSADTPFWSLNQPNVLNLDPSKFQINLVVSGLTQPVFITHAGDGSARLFIVERAGIIRIFNNGSLNATPFLDMRSIVNSASGEQGLLALAFHPQYETNGYFYTVHTNSQGSLVLSRFTVSPPNSNQATLSSRNELLVIPHPFHLNHNGGTLAFGADGYLYWSTGDGGGSGDPDNNAQNLNSLLGKILRLDVNTFPYAIPQTNPFYYSQDPNIRKEIWAYGLRNPWRMSFDRLTNDLYIGDVGQGSWEEIDFQPATSAGGENYGWRIMEGNHCYNPSSGCDQSNKVLPVAEYDHSLGCSVTGGYVYRGSAYPSLQGHYIYADFCSGRFFDLRYSQTNGWISSQLVDTSYGVSTFGEDEGGELYFADYYGGGIYKIGYDEVTTFSDVPASHWAWQYIERLYDSGITSGCATNPLRYCPSNTVTRAQMAIFLLRGIHGASYTPPSASGTIFNDVTTSTPGADWIEQLYAEGITSGCGGGNYCPNSSVTRAQMAIFLLRARHGASYTPPPATGMVFSDVTTSTPGAAWIEQLYAEGITSGCDAGRYCPAGLVTRAEMAVFLVRTFNLP
ncbi:MAG TPA: PQQ-dependent sugar dehydrogenase [Anaerolineales bacterium]|nr:PQQ-dependent sugar dehydrogenase [Anaerolineales bacterium]